ncbi:hypothetical protein Tco_0763997 [Tanacetum coccineum]
MIDFQELVVEELWRLKHVSSDKPPSIQAHAAMKLLQKSSSQSTLVSHSISSLSDPIGHLPERMNFLAAHVHGSQPGKQIRIITPHSAGNKFPTLLDNVIQENLPRFTQLQLAIRHSIHINVQGKMNEAAELLRDSARHQMKLISYIEQILHS